MGNECSHPSGCPAPKVDLNTVDIKTIDFSSPSPHYPGMDTTLPPIIGSMDAFIIPGACGPAGTAHWYGPDCPDGWEKSEAADTCTYDSSNPGCELKCDNGTGTCGTGKWTGQCMWSGKRSQCTRKSTTPPEADDAPNAATPPEPEYFGADEGASCSLNADCLTHLECVRGECAVPNGGISCKLNEECPAGFVCLRGVCNKPVVNPQNTSGSGSSGSEAGGTTTTNGGSSASTNSSIILGLSDIEVALLVLVVAGIAFLFFKN